MTQTAAMEYARNCKKAKREGKPTPERPDNATSTSGLLDTHKAIVITRTTLSLVNSQFDMLIDFLWEMKERSPQTEAYAKLAENIAITLQEAELKLKHIR